MKRTAQTLFELAEVIGECLSGELHIILVNDYEVYKCYRIYSKEDNVCFDISMGGIKGLLENIEYHFEPVWQGNNKLTVYTANQLLEQFQK